MKKHILSLNEFLSMKPSSDIDQPQLILETVQLAKQLLLKNFAEKRKKEVRDLNDSETKFALTNKKFEQVKELVGKTDKNGLYQTKYPNLVYAFTKFYCIENASMEEIEEIFDLIKEYGDMIPQLPLKSVEAYVKDVDKENDSRPCYERLRDDLVHLEEKRKVKRYVNDMIKAMRDEYNIVAASNDPKDKALIERFDAAVLLTYTLPDIKAKNEDGETKVLNAITQMKKQARGYIDTRTHPEFKDRKVAFTTLVDDLQSNIDSWGKGSDEFYDDILSLGAEVGLIYYKKGFIGISVRTPDSNILACGDTNFCIKGASAYWSITNGSSLQLYVLDFNKSKVDETSMIAFTVNNKGIINQSQSRSNNGKYNRHGRHYTSLMKELKYPEDLIETFKSRFDEEVIIKQMVQRLYKKFENIDVSEFIGDVMKLKNDYAKNNSDEQFGEIARIVASLLIKENEGANESWQKYKEYFFSNGILSHASFEIFKLFVGKNYTNQDVDHIINVTNEEVEWLENETAADLASELPKIEDFTNFANAVIAMKDEVMAKILRLKK